MKVIALKTHVSSRGRHLVGDAYDEQNEWAKDKIKRGICATPDSKQGKAAAKQAKAREDLEKKRRTAAERQAKKVAKGEAKKAAKGEKEKANKGEDGKTPDEPEAGGDGDETDTDKDTSEDGNTDGDDAANEEAATEEAEQVNSGDTPLNV